MQTPQKNSGNAGDRRTGWHSQLPVPSLVTILIILAFSAGCSLDYENERLASELKKDIPDTVMYGFRQINVERHVPTLEISAESVSGYNRDQRIHLEGVKIHEYSGDGKAVTEGEIGAVRYDLKERIIELDSGVYISRLEEDGPLSVEGESFTWFENENKISAPADSTVSFTDGTEGNMSGRGFSAETDTSRIHFSEGVSGYYAPGAPDER